MGSQVPHHRVTRRTGVETLETRQVFSADPFAGILGGGIEHHGFHEIDEIPVELHGEPLLEQHGSEVPAMELPGEMDLVHHAERTADFWIDRDLETDLDQLFDHLEKSLAVAHNLTGATQARADYGFTGVGQTIAVIDSGIAWDHAALGGGYGANYRVVGGWDFTENDANPYDDGPEGSHGTHVAGIVGAATGGSDSGVAPGVDLVGLRVFDDAGNGFFSWVEQALRWVHTNRNSFANPITAVNLSLGTAWNSASAPSWAMLEDEFAQLEAAGIFISVSAGNAYTTYNAKGLSYPAASSHVVPVMSVDDNGNMSSFSQRHERAIAAPGRTIRSTVPDYAGNHNGVTDDWASFSGTSMAAPYVAGASAIIRQAMQFVGRTDIDQWDIYDHMMATANDFFDSATNTWYKRLNVKNAIDALMPIDEYGSSVVDAYNMGTLGAGSSSLVGTIGKLNDVDFFRFTASVTGTVTFTADTSHEMVAAWSGGGVASGNTYSVDVVAGQSYTVGLFSTGGIGHYTIDVDVEDSFSFNDWGTISQKQINDLANSGETWYRVTASQAGFLTAEALFASAGGSVDIAWFDANMQQVAAGATGVGGARVDAVVVAGQQLYLRVTGTNADVDFRITNLVSRSGSTVHVGGTSNADVFTFTAGTTTHSFSVNGAAYGFAANDVTTFNLAGGAKVDTFTYNGTAGNESARIYKSSTTVTGVGYVVVAIGMEDVYVHSGGGADTAQFYDTTGDERFTSWSDRARLVGGGAQRQVFGYRQVTAYSSGGYDTATFYDSAGDDVYTALPDRARITGAGFDFLVMGYDRTMAYATAGGYDRAVLYDSAGDDTLTALPDRVSLVGATFYNFASGFDRVASYASTGFDRATFNDSAGDDTFTALVDRAAMTGAGYYNVGFGFDRYIGNASAGFDRAIFYDSAGDDTLTAMANGMILSGANFYNVGWNFEQATAYASNGYDRANYYDSSGDDVFNAYPDRASMAGSNYLNTGWYFDRNVAYASTGNDQANFFDSAGDDHYIGRPDLAVMSGSNFYNVARGFDRTTATASQGGYDRATLQDSTGADALVAALWGASLSGSGFHNEAYNGFDEITANLLNGGNDWVDVQATDYVFNLVGLSG